MTMTPEQIVQKWAGRLSRKIDISSLLKTISSFEAELQPLADLIRAAEDAKLVIYEELHAAGTEEVKQHPALKRHSTIYDQLEKALNALDKLAGE